MKYWLMLLATLVVFMILPTLDNTTSPLLEDVKYDQVHINLEDFEK